MPKGIYTRRPRKLKQYTPALVSRVAELYASGQTQAEIGADVSLSQKVIHTLMRRHGITARVAAKRDQWGANNHAWKGDQATYAAFHYRLYSRFGKPSKCTSCGTDSAEHYDYANLTGRYECVDDYAAMCRSCHWKLDGKVNNIFKGKEGCRAEA